MLSCKAGQWGLCEYLHFTKYPHAEEHGSNKHPDRMRDYLKKEKPYILVPTITLFPYFLNNNYTVSFLLLHTLLSFQELLPFDLIVNPELVDENPFDFPLSMTKCLLFPLLFLFCLRVLKSVFLHDALNLIPLPSFRLHNISYSLELNSSSLPRHRLFFPVSSIFQPLSLPFGYSSNSKSQRPNCYCPCFVDLLWQLGHLTHHTAKTA